MRNSVLFSIFVTICSWYFCSAAKNEGATYTSQWDNINLDEVLNNSRLFNQYYFCLMDKGRCGPDGTTLKKLLPDALATNCEKCTDKQKEAAIKVVTFISKNKPEEWKQLRKKYDPRGEFEDTFGKQYGKA